MLADNLIIPGRPPRFRDLRHERNAAALRPAFIAASDLLQNYLNFAPVDFIAVQLELLRTRYPAFAPDASQAVADELDDEWLEDLEEYPLWAIQAARKAWRSKDTAFAPRSAGQLMASVRPDVTRLRMLKRRADQAIAACEALTERTAA